MSNNVILSHNSKTKKHKNISRHITSSKNSKKVNKTKPLSSKPRPSNDKNTKKRIGNIGQNQQLNRQNGGNKPYLARLREKGDKPITGNDLDRAMTEIMTIMKNIQYTSEGQQFSTSNILLDYFNGNEQAMENYIRYQVIPKYVSVFPPYINIRGILNKLNEVSFITTVYQQDAEFKRRALIESGVDPATINSPENTYLTKVMGDISRASAKFQQTRRIARL